MDKRDRMIQGRDIIFISSIDWDDRWQAPQELALRLSKAGNRILYIENTGIRAPELRDTKRVLRRLKRWAAASLMHSARQVLPGLYVHSPLVFPPFSSVLQSALNRRLFLPMVGRVARRLKMKDPVIWTFLPTETTHGLLDLLSSERSAVVYYCAADFTQLTTSAREIEHCEAELVKRSDVVFSICEELAVQCRRWNNNVHLFPYGVNLKVFPLQVSNGPESHQGREGFAWTRQLPPNGNGHNRNVNNGNGHNGNGHKVVGYVGGLHRHVSVNMLVQMARARPAWSWVFVGSSEVPLKELAKLPNVYLVGHRPHQDLAHYIRTFDVCIVPYMRSAYTETVVPSKINEYLAMGKPVVSTNLPAVCDFNDEHQVLITTDDHSESFLSAIGQAFTLGESADLIARRRAVASQAAWDVRLEAMSELIAIECERKARKIVTRTAPIGIDIDHELEAVS